jgi:hypothetical protein
VCVFVVVVGVRARARVCAGGWGSIFVLKAIVFGRRERRLCSPWRPHSFLACCSAQAGGASAAADPSGSQEESEEPNATKIDLRGAGCVAAARAQFNQLRAQAEALPEGKQWFVPAADGSWRVVAPGDVCEGRLEYKLDLASGTTLARLPGGLPRAADKLAPAVAARADPAAARAMASGRAHGDGRLSVGQQVAVLFVKGMRTGTTEPATIRMVHEDGSANVEFDITGDRETGVPPSRIQARES